MKKQIFATIPESIKQTNYLYHGSKQYENYQIYTNRLDLKINAALNSQSKVIKNKQIQLENQLNYLQEKYYKESQKLRQMEAYFVKNCESILKEDIEKWTNNQKFFTEIFKQYQNQIQMHKTINRKQIQHANYLKNQLKLSLRQNFLLRLNQSQLKIQKKNETKLRTEMCQPSTQQSVITRRNAQLYSNFFQIQNKKREKRIKTESSLPILKKLQKIMTLNALQQNQLNYMKPIGQIKKEQKQQPYLNLLITLLNQYREERVKDQNKNWFQKLIFNSRNFQKIIQQLKSKNNQIKNRQNQLKKQQKTLIDRKSQTKLKKTKRIYSQN